MEAYITSKNLDAVLRGDLVQAEANKLQRDSVRALAASNISIASPSTTIDGVTIVANDRVLLTNQSTASQNGIWVYNGSALVRPNDMRSGTAVAEGTMVYITEGTTYGDLDYRLSAAVAAVDTNSQTWTRYGSRDSRIDDMGSLQVLKTNSSGTVGYATGTAGQVLQVNGGGTDIVFGAASGGSSALFGAIASGLYDQAGSSVTSISDTGVTRGSDYTYIRWATPDIESGISYDESHAGGEVHTSGGNGVITLTTAGVYEVQLTGTFSMSGTTSAGSFMEAQVTQSDGSTAVRTFTVSAFHRTAGTAVATASGSFVVTTPGSNSLLKVFVYRTSAGSDLTFSAANTSVLVRLLA